MKNRHRGSATDFVFPLYGIQPLQSRDHGSTSRSGVTSFRTRQGTMTCRVKILFSPRLFLTAGLYKSPTGASVYR